MDMDVIIMDLDRPLTDFIRAADKMKAASESTRDRDIDFLMTSDWNGEPYCLVSYLQVYSRD